MDCPTGVEPLEGYENREYSRVDMGGATGDCRALQKNFPAASIVDCVQSGGSSGIGGAMVGGGSSGGADGSGSASRFNSDNLWALLTLLLFVLPYIWYWVKKWKVRHAEAAAAMAVVPAVGYQVAEPEEAESEVAAPQQLELPAQQQQQQQLAIEPAPINVPLQPLIAYDLMG